jgi:DNA-binding transcriptional regulator GbsR (MarR family)
MSHSPISDTDVMKVWATLFLGESIGMPHHEIMERTRLSDNNVECALAALVDQGYLTYKLQQTGTGGTQKKFYQVKAGTHLTRMV